MAQVAIHLATGFEEVEALSVVDVFRRASIDITMVSVTGEKAVTGSHNITIMTDILFEDMEYNDVEMLVLPGGRVGADNLYAHEGLKKQIRDFHEKEKYLGAVCAAPGVYGRMGILEGQKAISYPAFQEYLKGAELVDVPAIRSNHFITGKGIGVALDFALELVRAFKGDEVVRDLRKKMVMD